MKQTSCQILIAILLLTFTTLQAQNSKPLISKEPSWVTITSVNYNNNGLDQEAEDGSILLDYEKQVSLPKQSTYYKRSIKVLSEAGVQNSSELTINFDPSYEQLIFHTIQIIRNGSAINQLALSKLKVIQQEKELSMHLYNGSLSAVLFLEDVRKGDVIEYSYTLKGFNPIFNGKYADILELRYSVPIYQLYYKLITPSDRSFTIKNNQATIAPLISKSAAQTIYEWKFSKIPPLHLQDNIPSWYDPYSSVMVSEYKSWKEVSDWSLTLFPFNIPLSAELRKKITAIQTTAKTKEEQVLAAVRFVQDDIRYMGIEMGEGTHRPNNPNKVFAQRFGDCKDKSYLLCTMLRDMGIEASPVLINSIYKKTLTSWLPSATAFDHCTVRVRLNNLDYWFDPTISYQRGRLKDIAYPDYQYGLVVNGTTTDLTSIPFHEPGVIKVKESFDIKDRNGAARLMVTTEYSGSFADNVRNSFNNNSRFEMQQGYEDFYKAYFENIKSDSLTFFDNEQIGIFTTKEYYTIDTIWSQKTGMKKVSFSPYILSSILKKPKDLNRTMPFGITYPAWYKEQVEVHLPEEWDAQENSTAIESAGFMLSSRFSYTNKTLLLEYEYKTHKDFVAPEEAKEFLASYAKADASIGYSITWGEEPRTTVASSSSWQHSMYSNLPTMYTLLGVCVFITVMIRRQRG